MVTENVKALIRGVCAVIIYIVGISVGRKSK